MGKNEEHKEKDTPTPHSVSVASEQATLQLLKKIYQSVLSHSRTVEDLKDEGKENSAIALAAAAQIQTLKRDIDEAFKILLHGNGQEAITVQMKEVKKDIETLKKECDELKAEIQAVNKAQKEAITEQKKEEREDLKQRRELSRKDWALIITALLGALGLAWQILEKWLK